jgi:hypothetical protein
VYSDNKEQYFKNFEEYNNRSADPVAILAAQNLAGILYGLENDYEEKLPENRFLKQYKFIDDKLRLINKDGKLIDENGRLINTNGRFINDKGEFIDKDGNIVDDNGDYVVQFSPFLDDDGKPIVIESVTDEKNIQDKDVEHTQDKTSTEEEVGTGT